MNTTKEIQQALEQAQKIAIFGHTNIDGDCIGSCLGLGTVLEKLDKKVQYFTPILPESSLTFVGGTEKFQDNFDYGDYDLLVFLDFSNYPRISEFTKTHEAYFDQQKIIVIDHHEGTTPPHAIVHKDIEITSCCELVYQFVKGRKHKLLDPQIATYFYLGLITDSGNFLFDHRTEEIFRNALELIQLGADKKMIINNLYFSNTYETVKFSGTVVNRIQIEQGVLHTYFTNSEVEQLEIDKELADMGFIQAQSIKGPDIYVRLMLDETRIRGSTRANGSARANCAQLCKDLFGGGGHRKAAGFRVALTKDFDTQRQEIIQTIVDNLYKYCN